MIFMPLFMFCNYSIDSIEYFAVEHNKKTWGAVSYFRASKIKHLEKNNQEYQGYVIGGSKSGTVDTNLLKSYKNEEWFNLCVNSPTFTEYYLYVKWLLENTDAQDIILYLSGHEVNRAWNDDGTRATSTTTEIVKGDKTDAYLEKLYYLTLDVESNINYKKVAAKYDDTYNYNAQTGMIDYFQYKSISKKNKLKEFVKTNVLQEYNSNLQKLFEGEKEIISGNENVEEMKKIVDICEDNNVNLTVILGPTFVGELSRYECEEFYTYLRGLVNIVDIWDFSGINDINMNPYNFINSTHCNYNVNRCVIDVAVGGKTIDGFGVYLNNANIDQYIQQRKADIKELRSEYNSSGSVQYNSLDGDGFLGMPAR